MGILQKVKTNRVIKYSALGLNDYTEIPVCTELTCIGHQTDGVSLYALCIFNYKLRAIDPNDLIYLENE